MSDQISASVENLAKKIDTFRGAMHPDTAKDRIAELERAVSRQFEVPGLTGVISLAPAEARENFTRAAEQQYDEQLRTQATDISRELADIELGLDEAVAAAITPVHPLDSIRNTPGGLSETSIELKSMRVEQQLDRCERKYRGVTLQRIADELEQLHPERDATTGWYLEDQASRGFPDLNLQPTPDDAAAMLRIRKIVAARQDARLAAYPELAAAAERFKKLKTASLTEQIRHLTVNRRGIAAV